MLLSSKYTQQDTALSVTTWPPWLTCSARLAAAPLAQSPFFRPRERRPPRGRRRHARAVEPLAPPAAARVATRIATHGAAHGAAHGATVYTNAPKRTREAIFANLCTLLRPHVCPQWRNSVHKCPKTDPRGHFCQSVYTPAPPPTPARVTGRGHGSHDIDGPMAP